MTGDDVQIRPMMADDREFILGLTSRLTEVGTPPWRDQEQMRAFHRCYAYAEATANARSPNEQVFIAVNASGVRLGFVHVMHSIDSLTGEDQGYVSTLAVHAAAEGTGVGQALMAAAEAWTREQGYRLLALDTFAMNARARSFYQRRGYAEETIRLVKEL